MEYILIENEVKERLDKFKEIRGLTYSEAITILFESISIYNDLFQNKGSE